MFFTLLEPGTGADPNGGRPLDPAKVDPVRAACEEAAYSAGGWLLGSRSKALDPYLAALRAALDPRGIMNPGALT
jgi:FAD/FMN-containing dehydrogenase